MNRKNIYGCASVIGQAHLEAALLNQDAFIAKTYSFGTVMVVADGLGSKKNAHIGADAVCKAVCEAVKIWIKSEDTPTSLLIRLIHSIWEVRVHPYDRAECGTTCLFSVYLQNGKLVMGQLGDGEICLIQNNRLYVLNEKEDDFGNLTKSINQVTKASEWKVDVVDVSQTDFTLFLATDGVTEDLIKQKQYEFILFLRDKIVSREKQRERNQELREILNNWITKHSLDDKTMIVFTSGVNGDEKQRNQ
jgi:serine/threonine protein phosphatase PrpC